MASPNLLIGRHSLPGAVYMVTTVASSRRRLFLEETAAVAAIDEIRRHERDGWMHSLAWVLMPDHLHWLFALNKDSLSRCMQSYKSRSAQAINASLRRRGRIWQPGFYDHRVRDDEDQRCLALYVVTNPIRAGLVKRASEYPYGWCRWPLEENP
ncbi:transposase [Stenotrophomonas sp. MMGLT7]|uniref:REP-associated tyrosine transposase n=1 Tax=Stenotrophomonas sp. MMGLT7 TaxID=2901227 RepID=UPI001E42CFCA|nr:transposase [Stenotrophomonas sp. MMGLT7]MCD7099326.1 transposase [Stenotrophomonas sp. MMGLT7]